MLNQVILKALFELVHPFLSLFVQLWISYTLIYVLLIKHCLDIFLWASLKLKKLIMWMMQTLCTNNSLVWDAFLVQVQGNFSHPISLKLPFERQLSTEGSVSSNRSSRCQVQRDRLHSKLKSNGQYLCQNCQSISEVILRDKHLVRDSHDDSSLICEAFKHSVGTQTLTEQDIVNTNSHFQTPNHNSIISIFGKKELDSEESLNKCLKSSNVKKQIPLKYRISPVRYTNISCECKKNVSTKSLKCPLPPEKSPNSFCKCNSDISARSLSSEFENAESFPGNQNGLKRTPPELNPEEFVDIPLESTQNVSELLASPLHQINLESMRNLRLQFSQDVCISRLSPEEKSIFSWNKLKFMCKVKKRFLKMKDGNSEIPSISQQPRIGVEYPDTQRERKVNLIAEDEESNTIGCCGYIFHRLKSKVDHKDNEGSVMYKKF